MRLKTHREMHTLKLSAIHRSMKQPCGSTKAPDCVRLTSEKHWSHLVVAYSRSPACKCIALKVPIQPRNLISFPIVHVTNKGLKKGVLVLKISQYMILYFKRASTIANIGYRNRRAARTWTVKILSWKMITRDASEKSVSIFDDPTDNVAISARAKHRKPRANRDFG